MDACDSVMDKIKKPRGLIRIDSLNNIKNKTGFRFSPRVIAYSVLMVILLGVFGFLLAGRTDVEAHILRIPGQQTYFEEPGGIISNIYNLEMVNKTFDGKRFRLESSTPGYDVIIADTSSTLDANEELKRIFRVTQPEAEVKDYKRTIELTVYIDGKKLKSFETTFFGPIEIE